MAPDFSTTGSKAAASPPVMGSFGLPRATRFETTTRFTGSPPDGTRELTAVHQYGSWSPFQRNETKFGLARGGTRLCSRQGIRAPDFDARNQAAITVSPRLRHQP